LKLAYISEARGNREINFQPSDFLMEAIEEFLESGAKPAKIGSCIIKIATATELLLKEKLEKLCPALVLEAIDDGGLQVAKLYRLSSKMLAAKELEKVEIRTASFSKLLNRTGKFFDIGEAKPYLSALHSIRNNLVHHRGNVDLAEVNLLLIEKIFPFLERFTNEDTLLKIRLKPEMWKRLRELADSSADIVATELAKKIAHFAGLAKRLSGKRTQLLLISKVEVESDEDTVTEGLLCPACKNRSLTSFSGWDVDVDEAGHAVAGWMYFVMRCKVCGLELDQSEIERIVNQFDKFLGEGQGVEREKWKEAIVEPDHSDYYP
jgi:hypothetical protein